MLDVHLLFQCLFLTLGHVAFSALRWSCVRERFCGELAWCGLHPAEATHQDLRGARAGHTAAS